MSIKSRVYGQGEQSLTVFCVSNARISSQMKLEEVASKQIKKKLFFIEQALKTLELHKSGRFRCPKFM